MGGLGLLTATWLHACGSASLALLGRSGRAAAGPGLTALQTSAALVTLARSDVGLAEDSRVPAAIAAAHGSRLGSFVHAAGIQVLLLVHLLCLAAVKLRLSQLRVNSSHLKCPT